MTQELSVVYGKTKWGTMCYLADDELSNCLQNGMLHEEDVVVGILHNIIMRSKVIFDVGAHAGSHCLLYAKLNPDAIVHAFEPQVRLFALLQHNIKTFDVKVATHNFALGNKDCEATMCNFIRDGPNANEPIVSGKRYNLGGRQIGRGEDVIKIRRLDDVITDLGLDALSFLKIDVEGFENFVLDGGYNTLKKYRPVIFFENNHKQVEKDMEGFYIEPQYKDVFATLSSLSYNIISVGNGNYLAI